MVQEVQVDHSDLEHLEYHPDQGFRSVLAVLEYPVDLVLLSGSSQGQQDLEVQSHQESLFLLAVLADLRIIE